MSRNVGCVTVWTLSQKEIMQTKWVQKCLEDSGFSDARVTNSIWSWINKWGDPSTLQNSYFIHVCPTNWNIRTSLLLPFPCRCFFLYAFVFVGYLNLLVATLSMSKCEMKPVKPAAWDVARQKLQPWEGMSVRCQIWLQNIDVQNCCEHSLQEVFWIFCRADRKHKAAAAHCIASAKGVAVIEKFGK